MLRNSQPLPVQVIIGMLLMCTFPLSAKAQQLQFDIIKSLIISTDSLAQVNASVAYKTGEIGIRLLLMQWSTNRTGPVL